MNRELTSILVLGAGRDQAYLIKTAKAMGLYVYCVDKQKDAFGAKYADEFFCTSTRNLDEIKKIIDFVRDNGEPLSGIITMGSDIPHIVAELCLYANTPSIPLESAILAKNKLLMKEKFKKHGVPTPEFHAVSDLRELKSYLQNMNFKQIVIKPIDQAGSKGVSLTTPESIELDTLLSLALRSTTEKQVLVEEFIEGPQISTEHIIYDGQIFTPGFADRNYDMLHQFLPQIMENGGWIPSLFTDLIKEIENEMQKAALALNLNRCIVKGDVVLNNGKPMVIELAARLSGGDFSESLVPLSSGVNYVRTAIELCLGIKPNFESMEKTIRQSVANRYFFAKPGELKEINIDFDIEALPWLKKFELWVKPGSKLTEINSHGTRSGVFVVVGDDRKDLEQKIAFIYEHVEFIYD